MNRTPGFVLPAALLGAVACAGDALAQAVQLPTFRFFTVQTTVWVPDRGAGHLGGVRRAASGSLGRGVPFLSQAPGGGRLGRSDAVGAAGGAASATILDHAELDAAVLAEARARRDLTPDETVRPEPRAGRWLSPAPQAAPVASVAAIRRQVEQQTEQRRQEALALIEKGRQAEAAGKPGVAKIYYQTAARQAEDDLRRRIERRLAGLPTAAARLPARRPPAPGGD